MHRTGKPITLITPESNCHRTWSWIVRGSTATLGHSAQSQVERFERENNQQNGRSRVLYWKRASYCLHGYLWCTKNLGCIPCHIRRGALPNATYMHMNGSECVEYGSTGYIH